MKVILIIILIWVIKIILTKAISLLEVLISCAIKGKKINYNTNKWNEYFAGMSDSFAIKYFVLIYIIASIISCVICYCIIQLFNIDYKEIIILSIFIVTLIFTMIKFKVKENDYIITKNKEVKEFLKKENK